jgi:hypothetical protein
MDLGTANIFATRAKPMINALDPSVRFREGFRMAAGRERSIRHRAGGPASESLRRTNPREGGVRLAVYGDLSE